MTEAAVVRVVIGLALVVAAILVSAWLARRAGLLQRPGAGLLKQVASLAVGPRQSIAVIEVQDTWLVVGISANQINTLHTMPAGQMPDKATTPETAAFAAKFSQALRRR